VLCKCSKCGIQYLADNEFIREVLAERQTCPTCNSLIVPDWECMRFGSLPVENAEFRRFCSFIATRKQGEVIPRSYFLLASSELWVTQNIRRFESEGIIILIPNTATWLFTAPPVVCLHLKEAIAKGFLRQHPEASSKG